MMEVELKVNFEEVMERVEKACFRAGRKLNDIKILGASKKQDPAKIRILYNLGIKIFGENYVQEAEKKISSLSDLNIEWHFIGKLQRNKVKKAINIFHLIETVDRPELALELEKRLSELGKKLPVFIEVNVGEEETKGGVKPGELLQFVESIIGLRHLEIRGLMCLPPLEEKSELTRSYFSLMRELFEKIKPICGDNLTELSMGTSHDFEVAIEEGATIIRLGTILFGKRL